MNLDEFQSGAELFFDHLQTEMLKNHINIPSHWSIDHICYRVETDSAYLRRKADFSKFGSLLIESEVNGRLISTFRLHNPIEFLNRRVHLIELPAPKLSKPTPEGFEHIEIVCDESFSQIKKRYQNCSFSEKSAYKLINPELALKLNPFTIKFHPMSLQSVIRLERNKKVFDALTKSEISKVCLPYEPLITGTLPLGINIDNSDVDIVLNSPDIEDAVNSLSSTFKKYRSFESFTDSKNGNAYGIVRFIENDVPFELYIESTPSYEQRAFRHFLIEERLLELGGDLFLNHILQLRTEGLKTEPAFAKALHLPADPFLELLRLQKQTDAELEILFQKIIPSGAA